MEEQATQISENCSVVEDVDGEVDTTRVLDRGNLHARVARDREGDGARTE